MKLPDIVYKPVRGPSNVIGPGAVFAEYQSKQRVLQSGLNVGEVFAKSVIQSERTEADLGRIEDLTRFEQEHGQKLVYTADDLKETSFDMGKRTEVPAFEVRPFLLENALHESIQARADMISEPAARKEWSSNAELASEKMVLEAVELRNQQSVSFNLQRGKLAIERAQAAGLHDEAAQLIDSLPTDREAKSYFREENDQARELFRLDRITRGENFQSMRSELEKLQAEETNLNPANAGKAINALSASYKRARGEASSQEGDKYYGALRSEDPEEVHAAIDYLQGNQYRGVLDESERFTWIDRLESGLKTINAAQIAQQKVFQAKAKRGVVRTTRLLNDGEVIDPTALNAVQGDVEQLRATDPDAAAVLDYDDAMKNYRFVLDFQTQPLEEQATYLGELQGDKSPEGIDRYNRASKIFEGASKALDTDSMSYAAKVGFFDLQPLPPADSQEFIEALQERDWAEARIERHYGKSAGPLTAYEADLFSDYQGDMVELADQVSLAMGERAPLFWEQVLKGGAGSQFVAGEIASRPGGENTLIARRVLTGKQFRKDLEWTDSNYRQLRLRAGETLGQSFGADMQTRNTYLSAAVDHYIAGVVSRGEQEYLQPTSTGLMIDEDLLESSVLAVSGGVVELDGMTVLAPEPGVSTDDVDLWRDSLSVEDLPYARQATREEMLERIQNGDIQLRPSRRGRDKFTLYDTYSGGLLSSAGDIQEPAVLQWGGAPVRLRKLRVPYVP